MDTGKSALGLDGNLAAALGYPIGIIAIICLIMEKENRFVKFHAGLASMLFGIIWLAVIAAYIGGLIYAAVKAYGGNKFMLPVIGAMAEKWTS